MGTKDELLELLRNAYEEEQAFVVGLSDEARTALGSPEAWEAKDVIAHLAAWRTRMAQRLEAVARDEPPPRFDDQERINAQVFLENRERPWDEVLNEAADAYAGLVRRVEALSEDELTNPERFEWLGGAPLWRRITGNSFTHVLIHLSEYHVHHNSPDAGLQVHQAAVRALEPLEGFRELYGAEIYNLACTHALTGQREQAILQLHQALQLNPALTDWSREDPDLVSLHDEPGFQALFTD